MNLVRQLKEVIISVLPIVVLASLSSLLLGVMDASELCRFLFSSVLVIIGLTLFLSGVDVGLLPIGNRIGSALTRTRSLAIMLSVAVVLGIIITIPEPDVQVLAEQVPGVPNAVLVGEFDRAFDLSSQYFVGLIVIVLHFIMFGFAMTLARKNRQIEENLRELEESRNELMRAYEKVEEATVIEERNRIAKEIHDTAGHSLTTVIMQTEAARLALGRDAAEAKRCIDAANLQAKNCLDGLRLSVHLLSGRRDDISFRDFLQEIIAGSSEGTGLTVRSKIDDIAMTEEAERFIANTLREGISNGVRHGGSTAFFFELRDMGSYVEFLLSDNGRGVDRKQFKEGFGLSGMRAKAEALGGMVHYAFEPGEGFEIRLSLPGALKRPAQPDREKQT